MNKNVSFGVAVLSGLRWSALARVSKAVFSIVVTIVMARLLSPNDFGLVAMASVFTGISLVFIDLGTGAALIREEKPTKEFINSVFWLNVSLSVVVWLVLMLVSSYVADLYDEAIVQTLIYLLAINTLLSGMTITFKALLEKKLRFKPLAVAQVVSQIAGSILGVTTAYLGYGVWSLVWMAIVSQFLYTAIVIAAGRFGIEASFQFNHIKRIFSYSSLLTLTQLLSHIQRRAEIFVVTYFMGSHLGGIYSQTHGLLRKPVKLINGFVSPVLFSAMSSVQEDKDKIRYIYLNMIQCFTIVYLPISLILLLFSEPLVLLVLGEKWIELAELLPLFGAMIFYMSLHRSDALVLKSLGKVGLFFKMYACYVPISILGCLIGVKFGLFGVALSLVIVSFALYLTSTIITIRLLEISLKKYFEQVSMLLFYGAAMFSAGYFVKLWSQDVLGDSMFLRTLVGVALSAMVYLVLLVARPVPAFRYYLALINLGPPNRTPVK